MRILVFGKTGQVASALRAHSGGDYEVVALGRKDADLLLPEQLESAILSSEADAVINAAAYTAVDQAEKEEELALRINGVAPGVMAKVCAAQKLPFLHISTDYVFDGSGDVPWKETDQPNPVNAYGRTKLEGERRVIEAGGQSVILRTSWVFSSYGNNFVKTMLRLGQKHNEIRIVADQFGGPTPADDIAEALLKIATRMKAEANLSGIFHYAGMPSVSWAEFAEEIFNQCNMPTSVLPIPSTEYPTPAMRPTHSTLNTGKIQEAFNIYSPDWRNSLKTVLTMI